LDLSELELHAYHVWFKQPLRNNSSTVLNIHVSLNSIIPILDQLQSIETEIDDIIQKSLSDAEDTKGNGKNLRITHAPVNE
jgi:hypothetical protein